MVIILLFFFFSDGKRKRKEAKEKEKRKFKLNYEFSRIYVLSKKPRRLSGFLCMDVLQFAIFFFIHTFLLKVAMV